MRKKIAVIVVLATIAVSTSSVYSNLLHAAQHTASQIPASYTIISSGNTTVTYDFSSSAGINKWTYRPQAQNNPPATDSEPSIPLDNYSRIADDDGIPQTDAATTHGYHAAHRFIFSIAENQSAITSLTILWNGSGTHDQKPGGAALYAWNLSSGSYDELDSTNTGTTVTLEQTVSGSTDYIASDGNITILVVQKHSTVSNPAHTRLSRIATDYIKIDVTHRGGA